MRAFLVCLLAALPVSLARAAPEIAFDETRVEILSFGIYCVAGGTVVDAPLTATGEMRKDSYHEWQAETIRVPARLGLSFGVVYAARKGFGPAMSTSSHPPFPGREITSYRSIDLFLAPPDGQRSMIYGFDYDFELAPGPWTFQIDAPDGPVLRAEFEVVPDDGTLFPEIECIGPPVS